MSWGWDGPLVFVRLPTPRLHFFLIFNWVCAFRVGSRSSSHSSTLRGGGSERPAFFPNWTLGLRQPPTFQDMAGIRSSISTGRPESLYLVLGVGVPACNVSYRHMLYLGNFPSAVPSVVEVGRYLARHLRLQGTAGDAALVGHLQTLTPTYAYYSHTTQSATVSFGQKPPNAKRVIYYYTRTRTVSSSLRAHSGPP